MKTSVIPSGILGGVLALGILTGQTTFGQNALQFTGANATSEKATLLNWASESNHIYQIQYANALATNADGSTAWQTLYDQYPSQGTNTFIGDFGNYDVVPAILHPNYSPMRYYRILDEGTNSGQSPSVMVTSPTGGNVLSDLVTVSVAASSSYPNVTTELYVDGQKMLPSNDGVNYFINTCEWPNGPHTLFASARALSGFPGPNGSLGILAGRAVSSYVTVIFSNLISRIAFSQPFFEPSLGQTQEVTAAFAANCNWTLQIQDVNSNTVRNASGSGNSMTFDWDGTGDGGTNIPDGVYTYSILAQTNGAADEIVSGGSSGGSGGSVPSPSFARSSALNSNSSSSTELWAVAADLSGMPVPLALYPPGSDTSSLIIFEATPLEIQSLRPSVSRAKSTFAMNSGNGMSAASASAGFAGPPSQSTAAPTRPPTAPVKNAVNSYGLAYWDYPDGRTLGLPGNGRTGHVHLNGDSSDSSVECGPLWDGESVQLSLAATFGQNGWKEAFVKADNNLSLQDLRRSDLNYNGGELFTGVTIGVFLSHGSYGTDPDYSPGANSSLQTYFPSGNSNDGEVDNSNNKGANPEVVTNPDSWLRMCQFGFGGSLKWMAMGACYSLTDPNYGSMTNAGAIPLKTTHLLCGATTPVPVMSSTYQNWGHNLFPAWGGFEPQKVADAWFNGGQDAFKYISSTNSPIVFRVTGYQECLGDTIASNTAPINPSAAPKNLKNIDRQVFP